MFLKYSLECLVPLALCLIGWASLTPQCFCAMITCPPPDFPENGIYIPKNSEYEVGSTVYFFCPPRFQTTGSSITMCQTNGRWSSITPMCDGDTPITNIRTSSREISSESAAIDGNDYTCFQPRNDTKELLQVFLGRRTIVRVVRLCLLDAIPAALQIELYDRASISEERICSVLGTAPKENGSCQWSNYDCNNMIAESFTVRIQDTSSVERATSLSICEILVFTIEGEWCDYPPKNLVPNGQLKVGRRRALLTCNEGFKERENRRVYATCEGHNWSYIRLQCIEILCNSVVTNIKDSEGKWESIGPFNKMSIGTILLLKCKEGYHHVGGPLDVACLKNGTWTRTSATCKKTLCDSAVTNVSDSEGKWEIDGTSNEMSVGTTLSLKCKEEYKLEGEPPTVTCLKNGSWTRTSATCEIAEPPKEYKRVAIAMGVLIVVISLSLLCLKVFLFRREKTRGPAVTDKSGEKNKYSSPGSSTLPKAEFSTFNYEDIQNYQCVPSAPPLESLDLSLDEDCMRPVDDFPSHINVIDQLSDILQQ